MSSERKNLKKSMVFTASAVTVMMLGFKVLGFLKQSIIAYYFGATNETDFFFVALGFLTGSLGTIINSLSVSTITSYTKTRFQEGKDKADRLINALIATGAALLLLFIIFILFFAPVLAKILAPGYSKEELSIIADYIRILSPCYIFVCTQFTLSAVLDSHKSFFAPRLETFIYSVISILFCIIFSKSLGVKSLLAAQIIAGFCFSLFLVLTSLKYHKFSFVNPFKVPEIKKVYASALPLIIGISVIQINEAVDKAIASGRGDGYASSVYYSQTLNQFVTAIIITNIGNILLANFVEMVSKKEMDAVRMQLSKAINFMLCSLIAVSVITVVCAKDIVTIVFFRGNFSIEAVETTSIALIGYAVGFTFIAIREMLARGLYAFNDVKRAMISSIITIICNIVLSVILAKHMGLLGITLGTCFANVLGMIVNSFFLKKYINDYPFGYHIISVLKCVPVAIVLFVFCFAIQKAELANPLVRFVLSSGVGLLFYVTMLYLLRVREVKEVIEKILSRIRK